MQCIAAAVSSRENVVVLRIQFKHSWYCYPLIPSQSSKDGKVINCSFFQRILTFFYLRKKRIASSCYLMGLEPSVFSHDHFFWAKVMHYAKSKNKHLMVTKWSKIIRTSCGLLRRSYFSRSKVSRRYFNTVEEWKANYPVELAGPITSSKPAFIKRSLECREWEYRV